MTKLCTDLEQSKKLDDILSDESADMCWLYTNKEYFYEVKDGTLDSEEGDIPAWSLAALLSLLPRPTLHQTNDGKWYCDITDNRTYFSKHYDNPVDACVEMVLKLKELNLSK